MRVFLMPDGDGAIGYAVITIDAETDAATLVTKIAGAEASYRVASVRDIAAALSGLCCADRALPASPGSPAPASR